MKQDRQTVVMDFTGIYEKEQFYKGEAFIWIDCRDIRGTNCYCDEEAETILKERIRQLGPEGIHFIDSGNYHYMTKLWTDKIQEPFVLILIDHHPDTQPSLFEGILSCGCWVGRMLEENSNVRKVVLLGAEDSLIEEIPEKYRSKIASYNEEAVIHDQVWQDFRKKHIDAPVYLTIDKDVLDSSQVKTNWNQGKLKLQDLKKIIRLICLHERVIGVDISGECQGSILEETGRRDVEQDDRINAKLLYFLEDHERNLK